MLFNSVEFIFVFLPLCLLIFTVLEKKFGRVPALLSLTLASAIFYASWSPPYLIILLISVLGNFAAGRWIQMSNNDLSRKHVLTLAIIVNLALLYYFKYMMFTLSFFHGVVDGEHSFFLRQWALPLGISFWTFQQINFLLERYNRRKDNLGLVDYVSIVLFFPHLIAGPIVRAAELGPQVRAVGERQRNVAKDIAIGVVLFTAGLVKKVVIADSVSIFPAHLYQLTPDGSTLHSGSVVAWFSIIAYLLQLYFDFSGYCDMGMGLARMFGFTFPINFNSPLKATSFVNFWRTWHMTLTRFFTETLHAPLAMALMRRFGDVKSAWVQSIIIIGTPVLFTFFITGIWHGAGSQFVVFGVLNGVFMAAGVVAAKNKIGLPWPWVSRIATFALVSIVFVFFRTPNLAMGLDVIKVLFTVPQGSDFIALYNLVQERAWAALLVVLALVIALTAPNLYEVMAHYHLPLGFKSTKKSSPFIVRRLGYGLAIMSTGALLVSLYQLLRGGAVEFLYFQF